MRTKPTILYLIDDLGRGGAETLLVGLLKELTIDYTIILVTLREKCEFADLFFSDVQRYSLDAVSPWNYLLAIFKLRRIIKRHSPLLVHSHLLLSSLVGKLACPAQIPFIFSVHSELSKNAFADSKILRFLEKITINKRQTMLAVSKTVLNDYVKTTNFKGKTLILNNYIDDHYFEKVNPTILNHPGSLKVVAVGNIKKAKNYKYLIESFKLLKGHNISLDIYGRIDHPMFAELEAIIAQNNLPVSFMGVNDNIARVLSCYDMYSMSSSHEGFGIAAVEAMACGLPLLLSDLPVLREVTNSNALFFDLQQPDSLAILLKEVLEGRHNLEQLSSRGVKISKKYTKQQYLKDLVEIYTGVLQRIK